MNKRGSTIPLGRIFGIPIGLDYSWFLIFALLTWSLSTNYYPLRYEGWEPALYWGAGALTAVLLFVSVLLHELGHAVAALAFRIPVRRIRLMIFGGVAELDDEPPHAGSEFLVAIAGPAVSVLLAILLGAGWLGSSLQGGPEPLTGVLGYLAFINLILAVFNLIPGFPLDGGRVLRAILWGVMGSLSRATRIASTIGRFVGFGFIAFGIFEVLTGGLVNGLWTGFIGLFLQGAARAEMQAQRVRDMLTGRTVGQLMQRNFTSIPGHVSVQQLVDAHLLGFGNRTFVVTNASGGVAGVLSADNLRVLPREQWYHTAVSDVMTPLGEAKLVGPETELWTALRKMEVERLGQLPVVEDGRLLGLLRREDVFNFLNALRRFGPQYV